MRSRYRRRAGPTAEYRFDRFDQRFFSEGRSLHRHRCSNDAIVFEVVLSEMKWELWKIGRLAKSLGSRGLENRADPLFEGVGGEDLVALLGS